MTEKKVQSLGISSVIIFKCYDISFQSSYIHVNFVHMYSYFMTDNIYKKNRYKTHMKMGCLAYIS